MRLLGLSSGALLAIVSFCAPAKATDTELIRSDLPFWGEHSDGAWPHSCGGDDAIAACSIFDTGDWLRTELGCTEIDQAYCQTWLRLRMGGVFHPHFSSFRAGSRETLKNGERDVTFIGALRADTWPKLFAMQIGFRGGSQFVLVSVASQEPGRAIRHMTILDARCDESSPGVHRRKAKFETMFISKYCAVDSKAALRRLALQALDRAPLATLDWIGEEPDDEQPPP